MSIDYDAIAEAISPERFGELIGAAKVAGAWRCPLGRNHEHGDRDGSFSIFRDGQRVAAKCHTPTCGLAGSPVTVAAAVWGVELPEAARRLADAIGLVSAAASGPRGEIIAAYDYVDEAGALLYQVVRFLPKDFRQRRPDGVGGWTWRLGDTRRVLYRLPELVAAVKAGKRVWVCEGERDVETLRAKGYVATTNAGGAGKWRPEYSEMLRGADVIVAADRDAPGRAHAGDVVHALDGVARRVVLVEPGAGKDVTDHLTAGRALAELVPVPVDAGASIHETVRARNARIRDAALATLGEVQRVASWGYGALDRLLGGLVSGWVYAVGGLAGNGKSTFALNVLDHLIESRVPTLCIGTEQTGDELLRKLAAFRTGVDEQRMAEAADLTDHERGVLNAEIHRLAAIDRFTFTTETRLDRRTLAAEIAWACDQRTGLHPRVILLDHVHELTQDRDELDALTRELKALAQERRVALILCAQLNRERSLGPFDDYTPPSLSRFKSSGTIGERANVALGLFRKLRPGVTQAQRRAVMQGEIEVTALAEQGVMGIACVKHRVRGGAKGRYMWLTLRGSRLESGAFTPPQPPPHAGDAWESEREEGGRVPF